MRRFIFLMVLCSFVWFGVGLAFAESVIHFDWEDYPEYIKERKSFKRFYWFHQQRQMPDETLPIELYWQVRAEEMAKEQRQNHLRELSWSSTGPTGIESIPSHWGVLSGRVRGLAVHPTNPDIAFVGAASGGIWKTENGGESWADVGVNLECLTFGAIAVTPTQPEVIYAGTGEPSHNGYSYDGNGIYKSVDGGDTWQLIGEDFGLPTRFSGIVVSPHDPSVVFASLFVGDEPGIWRSTDAGETWERVLASGKGHDVLVHPVMENAICAATNEGFHISTDGGDTWMESNQGLPNPSEYDWYTRIHLTLNYMNNITTLYAVIHWNSHVGAFKSADGGQSWEQLLSTESGEQGWYDLDIGVDPADPDHAFVLTNILRETVDGENFEPVIEPGHDNPYWGSPMHVDYHQIIFSPSNPDYIYVGCDGGVYRSIDNGITWDDRNNNIRTIQYYRMASHPTDTAIMFGGAQDNGNFRTLDEGETDWHNVTTGDGMECFVDYENPLYVYMATQVGNLMRSHQGGDQGSFTNISIPGDERRVWTAPFFMHSSDHNTIYSATVRPYRSTNRGNTWQALGDVQIGPITCMNQSPANPDHLIITDGTLIRISNDHGETWYDGRNGLPGGNISRVVYHPIESETIFAVYSGFYDERKLYRTNDLGLTWENVSGDLPNVPCSDVFIDPVDHRYWFIANDLGVYQSTNGGETWHRESDLPYVAMLDFDYFSHEDTQLLRIASHGRGVFQAELNTSPQAYIQLDRMAFDAIVPQGEIHEDTLWIQNRGTAILNYTLSDNADWLNYTPEAGDVAPGESAPIALTMNTTELEVDHYETNLMIDNNDSTNMEISLPVRLSVIDSSYTIIWQTNFVTFDTDGHYLAGHAYWDEGNENFVLTEAARSRRGRLFFSAQPFFMDRFRTEFDLWIGDGSGGEGITFAFVEDYNYPSTGGITLDFFNADGYAVEFDTEYNSGMNDPNGQHIAVIHESASEHLFHWDAPNGAIEDGQWHHVLVNFEYGAVEVYFDEELCINDTIPNYVPFEGYFGFTATTSLTDNWHIVDNILVLISDETVDVPVEQTTINTPSIFSLLPNYPNPFNPNTAIQFKLPITTQVKIDIYDVSGRLIKTLLDEKRDAGLHTVEWDGANTDGDPVSSGVYLYQMKADDFSQTRRMTLLR